MYLDNINMIGLLTKCCSCSGGEGYGVMEGYEETWMGNEQKYIPHTCF